MSEGRGQSQQRKKGEKKVHTYYEIKGGKISRLLRKCPRCGSFMAQHKGPQPRWACGGCGYTEFVQRR